MRTYSSLFLRLISASIFLLTASHHSWAADESWPPPPSQLELSTPYGTISVKASEYIYESRLLIDNHETIPKIEGIINITYSFALPKSQATLISINTGNNDCPIAYRWVTLQSKGYKISPMFGSCSERIQVAATGGKLTMQTPNIENKNKIDIYVYDGNTISQRTRPQPLKN